MQIEWPTDADDTRTQVPGADLWHGADRAPDGGSGDPSPGGAARGAEPADGAPGEDELHRSAVDAVDGLLDEVELALARLDDGTYGRCEDCGEPIDDGRLAVLPIVRTCGECDPERVAVAGAPSGEISNISTDLG